MVLLRTKEKKVVNVFSLLEKDWLSNKALFNAPQPCWSFSEMSHELNGTFLFEIEFLWRNIKKEFLQEKLILRAIDYQLFLLLSISVNNCCMINSPLSCCPRFFYCALHTFNIKVFSLKYRKAWSIREKTLNHQGFIISRCPILQFCLTTWYDIFQERGLGAGH